MRRKAIEIKNLCFSYSGGNQILKNVNLCVYEGESFALIGPNAAGKSTLLLHLNGVLKGAGEVRIFDEVVSRSNLRSIRSLVGMVFEDPNDQLFMATVFDDVAFGPLNFNLAKSEVEKRVMEILKEFGLEAYRNKASHHLSLGEKKKVSLATVLVLEPEILVLDEPTSGLDPGTRRSLIERLKGIKKTKVVATHDLDLVWEMCFRVALLANGEVLAQGNAREILANKNLLESHCLEVPLSLLLKKSPARPT